MNTVSVSRFLRSRSRLVLPAPDLPASHWQTALFSSSYPEPWTNLTEVAVKSSNFESGDPFEISPADQR